MEFKCFLVDSIQLELKKSTFDFVYLVHLFVLSLNKPNTQSRLGITAWVTKFYFTRVFIETVDFKVWENKSWLGEQRDYTTSLLFKKKNHKNNHSNFLNSVNKWYVRSEHQRVFIWLNSAWLCQTVVLCYNLNQFFPVTESRIEIITVQVFLHSKSQQKFKIMQICNFSIYHFHPKSGIK